MRLGFGCVGFSALWVSWLIISRSYAGFPVDLGVWDYMLMFWGLFVLHFVCCEFAYGICFVGFVAVILCVRVT